MNLISKSSLTKVLDALNTELKTRNLIREIQIFGSGALILLGLSQESRETRDLDMLSPTGDMQLLEASQVVAHKFNLDEEWLNSIGSRFAKYLPLEWNNRLELVYEASNLKIHSLSKKDLLLTKIKAYFNRGESNDLEDLLSIASSFSEIESEIKKYEFSDKNRLATVLSDLRSAYEKL